MAVVAGHLQPMNIFLKQEIDRIQRVISTVRATLFDLKLAIDGTIIMSESLRDALDSMYDAKIPKAWQRVRIPKCPMHGIPKDNNAKVPEAWQWVRIPTCPMHDIPKHCNNARYR